MQVFINGRFTAERIAKISISDPGFVHGEGIFETLLVQDGKLQHLREHLTRLRKSAYLLKIKIPFTFTEIKTAANKLIIKNKCKKAILKIILTPQTFLIVTRDFPERPVTARVCFVRMERCLPHLKTLNYFPTVLAQREAERRGFDEALLVNRDGWVTEGGRTNIFWVRKGRLFTPPIGSLLEGTTREEIIQLARKLQLKFSEKKVRSIDLLMADELFLTNAPMGIWPIKKIEAQYKEVGKITRLLQKNYA